MDDPIAQTDIAPRRQPAGKPRAVCAGVVAAGTLAMVAVTAGLLRLLGRRWWCKCGSLHLWIGNVWSGHNSQHLFDPYTFSHFQHGLLLYGALSFFTRKSICGAGFLAAILIECMWEVVENTSWLIEKYREATISLDYYGDSIVNSIADIAVCAAGYWFASCQPAAISCWAFAAVEVIMILWIRDSLILNALMLIFPTDAIKNWQLSGW